MLPNGGVPVIEDNAHGLFGRYRGKYLGTFGCLATLSFHETKNFTCGEGGALLINDPQFIERAEIIREKGTDRTRFFRGEVDKYTWVDVGSSYLLSDILAAFLYAQLEVRELIQSRRNRIWEYYYAELKDWASNYGGQLSLLPAPSSEPSYNFYFFFLSLRKRQSFILNFYSPGVKSNFSFLRLHSSNIW